MHAVLLDALTSNPACDLCPWRASKMSRTRSAFVLWGLLAAIAGTPAVSQEICKPTIAAVSAGHSEVVNFERSWTGLFRVNASRCATSEGAFEIEFVRLKDGGPDLAFSEWYTWMTG